MDLDIRRKVLKLYMQFTEAVARSSRHQSPVELPLREFSNPSL